MSLERWISNLGGDIILGNDSLKSVKEGFPSAKYTYVPVLNMVPEFTTRGALQTVHNKCFPCLQLI